MDQKRGRSLAMVIAVIVTVLVVCGAIAYRIVVGYVGPYLSSIQQPPELNKFGVVTGGDAFDRTVLYAARDLGEITDIQQQAAGSSTGEDALLLVGEKGAVWLNAKKEPIRQVRFSAKTAGSVTAIDLHDGHGIQFLSHGSWIGPVVLFDVAGQKRWAYGDDSPGVDDSAVGDVDGDGIREIAVGFNGSGGLHLLKPSGVKLWKQAEGNVWRVVILEEPPPGLLIHSNAAGVLTVRDKQGNIVGRHKPVTYLSKFAIIRAATSKTDHELVAPDTGSASIFSQDGHIASRLEAPLANLYAEPHATHLQFNTPALAILLSYPHWQRSVLYIYDDHNRLVYQEIFWDSLRRSICIPTRG
jgi:hypothetical protein